MEFNKKLKIRLYFAIAYITLGIALIVTFNLINSNMEFLSSFGLALTVIGIVRLRNYLKITKSADSIKQQQIAETDERNVLITYKSRSISFIIYIVTVCIAVIVLSILNKTLVANILLATVCFLIFVYWVSYWIINKKS